MNLFAGSITITLGSNLGLASLTGATTRYGSPAEFDDLSIDKSGRGYSLIASSPLLLSGQSSTFDIMESAPTRNAIAFRSRFGIMVMRGDGSEEAVSLVADPAEGLVGEPAWAPDGTRLAFVRSWWPSSQESDIYLINPDGSDMVLVQHGSGPAWSPDGNTIAFSSGRDGNEEIYVMRPDGSGVVRLTNDPASDLCPTWSPDGTKLAFTRRVGEDPEIFVMHADGTGVSSLHVSGDQPAWSPDGSRIAFTRSIPGVYGSDIYVMGADGSRVTRLTNIPSPAYSRDPVWSPDGRIVVTHTPDADNEIAQLYIMEADGSGFTFLGPGGRAAGPRSLIRPGRPADRAVATRELTPYAETLMRREPVLLTWIVAATVLGACSDRDSAPLEPLAAGSKSGITTFDVPGVGRAFALDVNNVGVIVGRYRDDEGQVHGFVRDKRGGIATIDVPGAVFTVAAGINDRGDIAGQYALPEAPDERHGFLLRHGEFTTLDPDGSFFTNALGINDRGDVTGRSLGGEDEFFHGYRLRGGKFEVIDVPEAVETDVWRSTSSGRIVGGYLGSDELPHLFVRDGKRFETLALPGGATLAFENGDINARGDIVGAFCDEAPCGILPEVTHGFLLADGHFTVIDVPGATSTATLGINDRGDIVGGYFDSDGAPHGFLMHR